MVLASAPISTPAPWPTPEKLPYYLLLCQNEGHCDIYWCTKKGCTKVKDPKPFPTDPPGSRRAWPPR